jgi:hypothetical protein
VIVTMPVMNIGKVSVPMVQPTVRMLVSMGLVATRIGWLFATQFGSMLVPMMLVVGMRM